MAPDRAAHTFVNLLRELARNSVGSLRIAPLIRRPRGGPVRIALQSYSIHLAQMYRTIAAELLTRDDVELSFLLLSHPQFPASTNVRLRQFVRDDLGIPPERIMPYHEALWEGFDLAIYNDVYARFPLRRTRNCLLTHGPLLEARFMKPSPLRKSVADFDVVAVSGRFDYDLVRAFFRTLKAPPELACVGFPFLDQLEHPPVDRETYLRGLSLDPALPALLFAPHWTSLRNPEGVQRFERVAVTLAGLEASVVIKPHACSLVEAMAGGTDWRSRLKDLAREGRVGVDLDPDDIPALAHTDTLITERSCRSIVFMQLGKPVIEFAPDAISPAEANRLAVVGPGVHIARTPEELMDLLGGGSRLEPRPGAVKLAAGCLAYPGRATERFVELVERSLPLRVTAPHLTAVGVRLATSSRALGRPRDSSSILEDTAQLRERLEEDGYLYLRNYFDHAAVFEARWEVVESLDARGLIDRKMPLMECAAASHDKLPVEGEEGRFPAVRRVLQGDRMLDLYRRLLGGEVRHYDHIWMRLMNPGQATGPHCDIVYMGRGTSNLYTSWVPLGDVPMRHGALLILEGSHLLANRIEDYLHMDIDKDRNWKRPRFRHGRLFRGGDYSRNPRGVQKQFRRRWLTTDYSAGDLVVFNAQTMHGSLDNVSGTLRLSADTRFQLASEPVDERWVGPRVLGHARKA